MKRSAPLNRGSGGLSRSTPLARSSGLAKRSAKTAKAYAGGDGVEGRRAFVARMLAERQDCEACPVLDAAGIHEDAVIDGALVSVPWGWCAGPTDVHEMLRRSAGGSIVDAANVRVVCRKAHTWIHSNPSLARELGLLLSRFAPSSALESP